MVQPRFAENFSECEVAVAQRPEGDTAIRSPQRDGQGRLFEELLSLEIEIEEPSIRNFNRWRRAKSTAETTHPVTGLHSDYDAPTGE